MAEQLPLLLKQVVAVVDARTTIICLSAAGQIQPLEEPFETLNGRFEHPPFHISCRDVVAPWMTGFVSDIRRRANLELRQRPLKERRKADERYAGKPGPPPYDENRPVDEQGVTIPRVPPSLLDELAAATPQLPELSALQSAMLVPETKRDARNRLRAEYDAGLVDGEESFTAEERKAIEIYGGPGYRLLNAALRSGDDSALDQEVKGMSLRRMLQLLGTAMSATELKERQVVLRALASDALATVQVGDVVHDDAFMSWSTSPTVAKGFVERLGDRVMVLELPAGHPALRPNKDEMELLIDSMTLRVVAVDEEFVRVVIV